MLNVAGGIVIVWVLYALLERWANGPSRRNW